MLLSLLKSYTRILCEYILFEDMSLCMKWRWVVACPYRMLQPQLLLVACDLLGSACDLVGWVVCYFWHRDWEDIEKHVLHSLHARGAVADGFVQTGSTELLVKQ